MKSENWAVVIIIGILVGIIWTESALAGEDLCLQKDRSVLECSLYKI